MKVSLIDSHVHLNDDSIYQRLEEVITAAVNVGVDQFICIGYDRFHSDRQ
jgi:Tat protein secretion system quality control protein TatD with DNase activity